MKIAVVSTLSILLTGCGVYLHDRDDEALLRKHEECIGEHDTIRNAKAIFFGMSDEKQMACAREKENFDNSPEGIALAEAARQEKEKKENEYKMQKSIAENQCKMAGAHLASIKGATLDKVESAYFKGDGFDCRVILSIGFDSRYYDLDLAANTGEYKYYALPKL